MSEMPQQAQFGAPPPSPSGMNRLFPWVRTAATGGAIVAAAIYLLQVGLPEGWRPASVAGDAAGDTVRHEIQAMKAEKIDLERRLADAQAQAQTKAQADLLVMQKTLETTTANVDPLAQLAGTADVLCIGGQAVAAMTQPDGHVHGDWRGLSTSDDSLSGWFNQIARTVAGVSCGMSTPLRDTARAVQVDSVRQVAAARGMPMTNGAVQVAAAPVQTAPPTQAESAALWDYAARQPADVYSSFMRGLPSGHAFMPMFYERVAVYRAAHPGT